jgi:hypothetical protein
MDQSTRHILQDCSMNIHLPYIVKSHTSNVPHSRECSWPSERGYSPLKLVTAVRGKHVQPVKNIILYHYRAFSPLVAICLCFGYNKSQSNLCTALTTWNTAEINCIISQTQNTTAFQASSFLPGILLLLVTNKRRCPFPGTEPLSRWTVNSTVGIYIYRSYNIYNFHFSISTLNTYKNLWHQFRTTKFSTSLKSNQQKFQLP